MKPHRPFIGSLLIASLLSFSGCTERGPLSVDPKIATREVTEHLPESASAARAKAFLILISFQDELNKNRR